MNHPTPPKSGSLAKKDKPEQTDKERRLARALRQNLLRRKLAAKDQQEEGNE